MRITVLILGLLLGLVMFLQTVVVYALGSAAHDTNHAQAAAIGIVMALLWLVACAFVLPLPLVSVVAFALAAVFGFAASKNFPDLAIWGGASLVLMALSFFGWRGKVKNRRRARAKEAAEAERDARYEALLR